MLGAPRPVTPSVQSASLRILNWTSGGKRPHVMPAGTGWADWLDWDVDIWKQ